MIDISDIPVRELLAHEPPMVLLDRVVAFDDARLVAEVDIRADSQFCVADGVPGWVGLEYMAQAVAAHAGYLGRLETRPPKIGYLLGTRSYQCSVPSFAIGQTLRVQVESLFAEMGLGAFACTIDADELLASATINVYQPGDGDVPVMPAGNMPG